MPPIKFDMLLRQVGSVTTSLLVSCIVLTNLSLVLSCLEVGLHTEREVRKGLLKSTACVFRLLVVPNVTCNVCLADEFGWAALLTLTTNRGDVLYTQSLFAPVVPVGLIHRPRAVLSTTPRTATTCPAKTQTPT